VISGARLGNTRSVSWSNEAKITPDGPCTSRERDLKWKIPVLNGLDFRGAGQSIVPEKLVDSLMADAILAYSPLNDMKP